MDNMEHGENPVKHEPEHPYRQRHRTAIVLAAVILVLILVIGYATRRAELASPEKTPPSVSATPEQSAPPVVSPPNPSEETQREAFIGLQRETRVGDQEIMAAIRNTSEEADRLAQGEGSLPDLAASLSYASGLCRKEAHSLRTMSIPGQLNERQKIREALNHWASAYELRADILDLLREAVEKAEPMPQEKVQQKVQVVNELMMEGAADWVTAGRANGLSDQDFMESKMADMGLIPNALHGLDLSNLKPSRT